MCIKCAFICGTTSHVDIAAKLKKLLVNVYTGRTEKFTEQELKDKIKEKWHQISVAETRKSISSWKMRLRLVDSEDEDHIHHLLDYSRGKHILIQRLTLHILICILYFFIIPVFMNIFGRKCHHLTKTSCS